MALDEFMRDTEIEIVPVTAAQVRIVRVAYQTYGRGNHPARLNFGDCFTYALAQETGRVLLFKGDDFAQTDVRPAI
ncbi:MAG: type II toxin-antitoxin system VapC family toxin [Hyphomicrobiales bacterium]|nr:type II toxin-antitoxin system VapC family toxin [Hyphomicrobiales bacterium]